MLPALGWVVFPVGHATEPGPSTPARTSLWDSSVLVQATAGWKENLLLSAQGTEHAPFAEATTEFSLWRLGPGNHQIFLFASFEDRRYLDTTAVDYERSGMAMLQWKQKGATLQPGVSVNYFHLDQIFDASVSEAEFGVLPVVGHLINARPSLRWNTTDTTWVEVESVTTRQFFAAPLDSYWELGGKFTLGRSYGHQQRSELAASIESLIRPYDTRVGTDADGLPMSGADLSYAVDRFEVVNRHFWDPARHWRSMVRFSVETSRDNAGGYFDYDRVQLAGQLRWQKAPWEVQWSARVSEQTYALQRTDTPEAQRKYRQLASLALRVERQLGARWKLQGAVEHEFTLSNNPLDEYTATTVRAGVIWEY